MVSALGRHVFRPAHLHMQVDAQGYEKLTTAFYPRGDPYLYSDAVFGVHSSLIVVGASLTALQHFCVIFILRRISNQ